MEHTTIAVDLAKSVFQVAVSSYPGRVDAECRLSRARVGLYFAKRPPAIVVLEACGSADYWGRELQRLGHTLRLLPPHHVRRYVPRNKTDRTDAKALLDRISALGVCRTNDPYSTRRRAKREFERSAFSGPRKSASAGQGRHCVGSCTVARLGVDQMTHRMSAEYPRAMWHRAGGPLITCLPTPKCSVDRL